MKTHLELSKTLRASDYAVLFWLCRINSKSFRIFDFGGNIGNLYYSYSKYLSAEPGAIDWTVFDFPGVTAEGRKIASERGATGLKFTDSPAGLSRSHVLLVSGSFHYWEKSERDFLLQFPVFPDHILLNRTPVHETLPSFITVQRTRTYAVPCIVRNAAEMLANFASLGYIAVDRWPALELALKLPFYPDRSLPSYSGFYFRRNDAR